jgi:hypothetical protein
MQTAGGTDLLPIIITALLGGGGAVFLGALIKGWSDLRAGVRAREREAVADLAAARADAEDRRVDAERDRDYWRSVAAGYGYQLRHAGMAPDPEAPVPPSEKNRTHNSRDRERAERGDPGPARGSRNWRGRRVP